MTQPDEPRAPARPPVLQRRLRVIGVAVGILGLGCLLVVVLALPELILPHANAPIPDYLIVQSELPAGWTIGPAQVARKQSEAARYIHFKNLTYEDSRQPVTARTAIYQSADPDRWALTEAEVFHEDMRWTELPDPLGYRSITAVAQRVSCGDAEDEAGSVCHYMAEYDGLIAVVSFVFADGDPDLPTLAQARKIIAAQDARLADILGLEL